MEGRKLAGAGALIVVLLIGLFAWRALKPVADKADSAAQGNGSAKAVTAPSPAAIVISIASSNTKQDWLHESVAKFNSSSKSQKDLQVNGRAVFVTVLQEDIDGKKVDYRSGTMMSDTIKGKIKPTILSPGEESWLVKFKKEWQVNHNSQAVKSDAPVLVRTPLVIAMWESRAKAFGCWPISGPGCTWEKIRALATSSQGWRLYNRPEWGKFTFGYGYFGESNSGTLGVIAMCMSGVKKTKGLELKDVDANNGCGKFISGIESAKVHSGKSDVWLLGKMVKEGPEYLDAVITYESNVILMNRKNAQTMREPLVSVYPQDGTVVVGHPFAVLDGVSWVDGDQAAAAKIFKDFLLAGEQQEAVLAAGLRPVDSKAKLGSPIEQSFGASPSSKIVPLEVPEELVWDRVGEVWHKAKKRAAVVLVFDKSGSMGHEGKITAAVKGAQAFVDFMELGDIILWLPFDSAVYSDRTRGSKADVGEILKEEIRGTTAGGGTALYDAVIVSFEKLEDLRKRYGDSIRYGVVVLSDGDDRNSRNGLTAIQARLKPQEHDPHGVQVHSVCIGKDCDEKVLKTIAASAHGKFWKGSTPEEMVKVYREIASHY